MVFLVTFPPELLIHFMDKMRMHQKLPTSLLFLTEHHFLDLLSIYT